MPRAPPAARVRRRPARRPRPGSRRAWQEGGEALGSGTRITHSARVSSKPRLVGGEEILHRHRQPPHRPPGAAAASRKRPRRPREEHLEVAERADQGSAADTGRARPRRQFRPRWRPPRGAQALDLRAEAQRRDLAEHGGVARACPSARTPVERGGNGRPARPRPAPAARRGTCIEPMRLSASSTASPCSMVSTRGPVPRWRCRRRPWRWSRRASPQSASRRAAPTHHGAQRDLSCSLTTMSRLDPGELAGASGSGHS